mgnify:CR=1 FL=1
MYTKINNVRDIFITCTKIGKRYETIAEESFTFIHSEDSPFRLINWDARDVEKHNENSLDLLKKLALFGYSQAREKHIYKSVGFKDLIEILVDFSKGCVYLDFKRDEDLYAFECGSLLFMISVR